MEFRPFGLDDRGEKICDISGVVVQSNVDYLCDYLTRTAGAEAAKQTMERLCRLLNDRLQDRNYHVTPDFLRNPWNSYAYEFVCYLREFCEQLSGDPQFHVNVGTEKKSPPADSNSGPSVFHSTAVQDVALPRQQICQRGLGV